MKPKSERIKVILDCLEDYRWNPDEVDPVKCANIIDDMYEKDCDDEWPPARHHLNNIERTTMAVEHK